ncbi:hypothetical protein [Prolixibacter sp. NT017]|uniref:hypothetical protein n=1 Tax=Prolixibacter sp. NT017 TaxID=2652390 RepID=UPI001273F19C|nr:hypothetical protein [Prolixibacter sp. NT017]GET26349.1 hypothetical protein NT017_26780 [Prolixibacter sp. NT017]
MKKFRDLNLHEKLLLIALVVILVLIAFNWSSFSAGLKHSFSVYTEQSATKN